MADEKPMEQDDILSRLVAPCGMNCRLCRAYMRDKKPCSGCRGDDAGKPKTRLFCEIKNCEKILRTGNEYCFGCESFPCAALIRLDKRYRTKYGMSMIRNLEYIGKTGLTQFVRSEQTKWVCPECRAIICVHEPQCLSCGYKWR